MAGLMTAPDELLLRLSPAAGGQAITLPCPDDLRFDRNAPGGHKTLSCTISWDRSKPDHPALSPLATVELIDRRSGTVVWWGRIADPGLSSHPGRPVTYSVTAEGGQSLLDGWRAIYALVDRDPDRWAPIKEISGVDQNIGTSDSFTAHPSDYIARTGGWSAEALFGQGVVINGYNGQTWEYSVTGDATAPDYSGIVRIWGSMRVNSPSAAVTGFISTFPDSGLLSRRAESTWAAAGTQWNFNVGAGTSGWQSDGNVGVAYLGWQYLGSGFTFTTTVWQRIGNVAVICRRFTAGGVEFDAAISPSLNVKQVIDDLVA